MQVDFIEPTDDRDNVIIERVPTTARTDASSTDQFGGRPGLPVPDIPGTAVLGLVMIALIVVGIASFENLADRSRQQEALAPTPPPPPSASSAPSAIPTRPDFPRPPMDVGFIGLPTEGLIPAAPERAMEVDKYPVHGGVPPFGGWARVFHDGRLIWYELDPPGVNQQSTGYLEQRLSFEGIRLVIAQDRLDMKDPMVLPGWLPASAWIDQAIRPFIPNTYGACLDGVDTAPAVDAEGAEIPIDIARIVSILPIDAADILLDNQPMPVGEADRLCIVLTSEDAGRLDGALRAAGLAQDGFRNRFALQYQVDETSSIVIEPRFPDGSIACTACD
jgi:hypothetical protein